MILIYIEFSKYYPIIIYMIDKQEINFSCLSKTSYNLAQDF